MAKPYNPYLYRRNDCRFHSQINGNIRGYRFQYDILELRQGFF